MVLEDIVGDELQEILQVGPFHCLPGFSDAIRVFQEEYQCHESTGLHIVRVNFTLGAYAESGPRSNSRIEQRELLNRRSRTGVAGPNPGKGPSRSEASAPYQRFVSNVLRAAESVDRNSKERTR